MLYTNAQRLSTLASYQENRALPDMVSVSLQSGYDTGELQSTKTLFHRQSYEWPITLPRETFPSL